MRADTIEGPEVQAARATLLALQLGLRHPEDVRHRHWIILPNLAPLPEANAIERLVNLPKPLGCVGFPAAGLLAVGCWPYTSEMPERAVHDETAKTTLRSMREQYGSDDDSLYLLGRGQQRLLLRWNDVSEWFIGYHLVLTSFVVDWADEEARRHGAIATITIPPGRDRPPIRMHHVPGPQP